MMQMLGLGRTVLDTILGMMGIATSAGFKVAWATLRHAVGVAQQHLADCAQVENRAAEIAAMQQAFSLSYTMDGYSGHLPYCLTWCGRRGLPEDHIIAHPVMLLLLQDTQRK